MRTLKRIDATGPARHGPTETGEIKQQLFAAAAAVDAALAAQAPRAPAMQAVTGPLIAEQLGSISDPPAPPPQIQPPGPRGHPHRTAS